MLPHLVLRDETTRDTVVIAEVTIAAFRTYIQPHRTFMIEALRNAKALIISLVAELDGQIVGHIAFSLVTMSDDTPNWYAIGPVSVLPEYQRQEQALAWSDCNSSAHQGAAWSGIPNTIKSLVFKTPMRLR